MGIGPGQIDMYINLFERGDLRKGAWILDIGTQELFCESDPGCINRLIEICDGEKIDNETELRSLAGQGWAAEMFERADDPAR